MSIPAFISGSDPETIEARLSEMNARNGHIGRIVCYVVESDGPPRGAGISLHGWAEASMDHRSTYGREPKDPRWGALIAYEEKP